MDDGARAPRLLGWALGTFHTVFFFLLFVIVLYLSGSLGQLLSSLNTLVGVAIFAVLWIATTFCTGQVVRGVPPAVLEHPFATFEAMAWVILRSAFWGAVNGFLFLLGLLTVLSFANLPALFPVLISPQIVGLIVSLAIFVPIASVIALIIGGVIGFVFAWVDFVLLGMANMVYGSFDPRPNQKDVVASSSGVS